MISIEYSEVVNFHPCVCYPHTVTIKIYLIAGAHTILLFMVCSTHDIIIYDLGNNSNTPHVVWSWAKCAYHLLRPPRLQRCRWWRGPPHEGEAHPVPQEGHQAPLGQLRVSGCQSTMAVLLDTPLHGSDGLSHTWRCGQGCSRLLDKMSVTYRRIWRCVCDSIIIVIFINYYS